MTPRADTSLRVELPPVTEPPDRFDPSEFCRGVNERILELAPYADAVDFVCECGDPRCFVTVVLSAAEFRDAAAGGYVVAPGHARAVVLARSRAGYDVEFAPLLLDTA